MPVRQFLVFYFADISFFHGTLSLYDIRHCSGLVNWPSDIQLFLSLMKSLSTWYLVYFCRWGFFPPFLCAFTLFFGMAEFLLGFWSSLVFLLDEERSLGFGLADTWLWFTLSLEDFDLVQMRPGLRQGAYFIGFVFLVWTVDLVDFRPNLQDFLCLIFSFINIVYS